MLYIRGVDYRQYDLSNNFLLISSLNLYCSEFQGESFYVLIK